jgi:hypothetical protein
MQDTVRPPDGPGYLLLPCKMVPADAQGVMLLLLTAALEGMYKRTAQYVLRNSERTHAASTVLRSQQQAKVRAPCRSDSQGERGAAAGDS